MDEPFLDLGKSFQSQQKEIDNSKEAWEMHEFLTPRSQEMGEEREMLVDEEYELYQDGFQPTELYSPSHVQEAARVPSVEELHLGAQWLHGASVDGEPAQPQEARALLGVCPPEVQQWGCSPDDLVRGLDTSATSSVSSPACPLSLSHQAFKKQTKSNGSLS